MKFGDAKPQTRGDSARLEDLVDVLKLPNGKWVQVRILPNDIIAMKTHWINILAGKTKREVKIPKLCVSFDPMTEETNAIADAVKSAAEIVFLGRFMERWMANIFRNVF